jgi:hypothetical protein
MSELEPLPDELKRLFDAERAAPTGQTAARAGIRAKLATSVGKATLGHATIGIGIAGKTIVALALAVAAAGGGAAAWVEHARAPMHHSSPIDVAPAARVAVIEPATVAPPPAATGSAVEPPPRPVSAVSSATPRPPASPPPSTEAVLLRDAWIALSADQPARALELADTDERAHGSGPLVEERDALRVLALAKLGRADEARAAATQFATRYPNSVHGELVRRAVSH